MKAPALRAHCVASHGLDTQARAGDWAMLLLHDAEHERYDGDIHHHDGPVRLEILEAKVERLETRLSGVLEVNQLWDGS